MWPTDARCREVFDLIERTIEQRWGIPVRITDVPHPFTGDLTGSRIEIDFENSAEDALFILVHLFGHTVQWNCSAEARRIGFLPLDHAWTEPELAAVEHYEREACRYSLALLHDCGVYDLDQWLSDFAACDARYLMSVYRTGQKAPFRDFWRTGEPRLSPLPIPDFSPEAWRTRAIGVVI